MKNVEQIKVDTEKEIKKLEKDIKDLKVFLRSLEKKKKRKYIKNSSKKHSMLLIPETLSSTFFEIEKSFVKSK